MNKGMKYNSIICGYLIFIMACFVNFIKVAKNKSYSLLALWFESLKCGSFWDFWWDTFDVFGIFVIITSGILCILALLYLTDALFLCCNKKIVWIESVKKGVLYISFLATAFLMLISPLIIIIPFTGLVEFMLNRYLEDKEERERQYNKIKDKERKEKEERKKRLYFPGKYSREFHVIIWENFRQYRKDAFMLVWAGSVNSFILFTVAGAYDYFFSQHSRKDIFIKSGLQQIFIEYGTLLAVILLVFLVFVTSQYLKMVRKKVSVFILLGIRKNTLLKIIIEEYVLCFLLAGVIGSGGSLLVLLAFGVRLHALFFILATGLYTVLMILSFALNQGAVLDIINFRKNRNTAGEEKRPVSKLFLRMAAGALLMFVSLKWYGIRKEGETLLAFIPFAIALLFLVKGCTGLILKSLKGRKVQYYKRLLSNSPFYHRFHNCTNTIYLTVFMQFFIMGIIGFRFLSTFIVTDVSTFFPYDIVCKAYDADMVKLDSIMKKYNIKSERYPMLCVTSVDGDSEREPWYGARPIMWIQGQHIAISEMTYNALREEKKLKSKKLDLKPGEWHVVYQQDPSEKAQPIDWDSGSVKPRLRIGQPLTYYNTADVDNIFPMREIKSEEKLILTGMFQHGLQENIIVMCNEEFDSFYNKMTEYNQKNRRLRAGASKEEWKNYNFQNGRNMTEGPTTLLLWNVPSANYGKVVEELSFLEKEYALEKDWDTAISPFYGKVEMIGNTKAEIGLKRIIGGFLTAVLLLLCIYILYSYYESELPEWKQSFRILDELGMHENERNRLLSCRIGCNIIITNITAFAASVIYISLTLKIRYFGKAEVLKYVMLSAVFMLLYLLVWALVFMVLRCHLKKKIRGR